MCTSVPHSPACWTATSTSPATGSGRLRSLIRYSRVRCSGPLSSGQDLPRGLADGFFEGVGGRGGGGVGEEVVGDGGGHGEAVDAVLGEGDHVADRTDAGEQHLGGAAGRGEDLLHRDDLGDAVAACVVEPSEVRGDVGGAGGGGDHRLSGVVDRGQQGLLAAGGEDAARRRPGLVRDELQDHVRAEVEETLSTSDEGVDVGATGLEEPLPCAGGGGPPVDVRDVVDSLAGSLENGGVGGDAGEQSGGEQGLSGFAVGGVEVETHGQLSAATMYVPIRKTGQENQVPPSTTRDCPVT